MTSKLWLALIIFCFKKGNRHYRQNVWRFLIRMAKRYEDHLSHTEKESFLVFVANGLSFFYVEESENDSSFEWQNLVSVAGIKGSGGHKSSMPQSPEYLSSYWSLTGFSHERKQLFIFCYFFYIKIDNLLGNLLNIMMCLWHECFPMSHLLLMVVKFWGENGEKMHDKLHILHPSLPPPPVSYTHGEYFAIKLHP